MKSFDVKRKKVNCFISAVTKVILLVGGSNHNLTPNPSLDPSTIPTPTPNPKPYPNPEALKKADFFQLDEISAYRLN